MTDKLSDRCQQQQHQQQIQYSAHLCLAINHIIFAIFILFSSAWAEAPSNECQGKNYLYFKTEKSSHYVDRLTACLLGGHFTSSWSRCYRRVDICQTVSGRAVQHTCHVCVGMGKSYNHMRCQPKS